MLRGWIKAERKTPTLAPGMRNWKGEVGKTGSQGSFLENNVGGTHFEMATGHQCRGVICASYQLLYSKLPQNLAV